MKSWSDLEPDKYTLVGPHRYTKGRSRPIDRIIIHHNAANNWTSEQVRDLWNTSREASAHYQVEANGVIGQLVNDFDTAWHAANADINARSIGIEHANISGPTRWQISDKTIEEGAHLTAALCRGYNLGRPQWGKNVFGHSQFAATSCPHQLNPGGEDHDHYMKRAQYWYDNPAGAPAPKPPIKEDHMAADDDVRRIVREEIANFCGPIGHDVKRLCVQMGMDADDDGFGRVPGWVQTGHRSFIDLLSAVAAKVGVSRTKDTLPELPAGARNPKLKG